MVRVRDIMTPGVIQVSKDTSVVVAAKIMASRSIGSLFVTDAGVIVGVVTEPDIVRKVVGAERAPYFLPVEDIMSSPIVGIDEWRSIGEAAELMQTHATRHLAVTRQGAIVGVLSVRDLLHPVAIDEF